MHRLKKKKKKKLKQDDQRPYGVCRFAQVLRCVHFPGNRRLPAPQPDGQVPVDALGRDGTQGASALWRVSHGHDRKRRRRKKEESGKERTDTEEEGKHTGQFIERQTVTLGPIATGRRTEAFESEMKKSRGEK